MMKKIYHKILLKNYYRLTLKTKTTILKMEGANNIFVPI